MSNIDPSALARARELLHSYPSTGSGLLDIEHHVARAIEADMRRGSELQADRDAARRERDEARRLQADAEMLARCLAHRLQARAPTDGNGLSARERELIAAAARTGSILRDADADPQLVPELVPKCRVCGGGRPRSREWCRPSDPCFDHPFEPSEEPANG
jgi:hypothetical protein